MNSTVKDNVIGLTIADRYRVDELFSTGGVSKTYRAFDTQEQKDVLVRVLHSHKRSDANAVKRFEIAARAAAKMSHPGIVPLLHSGFLPDGLPYLVYEFIRGHNLRDEIAGDKTIAAERTREILLQVTAALEAAHKVGVIHRNLKPGNILIKESEKGELIVYVTGFGIARQVSSNSSIMLSVTQTKKVVGSPTYMSPEQFTTADIDARSDVYALGVVAYEMLCGQPPYRTNSFLTTAAKHSFGIPDSIRTQNPDVPPYMESIIVGALRKATADRYQSMADLHEDLEKRECRFGEIKFADFAKKLNRDAGKFSKLAVFGMVCAALFVIAACFYCIPKTTPHNAYEGEPSILFSTDDSTSQGSSSVKVRPGSAIASEFQAFSLLAENRPAQAATVFNQALDSVSLGRLETARCRLGQAFAYARANNITEACAAVKYMNDVTGDPLYGWTLRHIQNELAISAPDDAREYGRKASRLGYEDQINEREVQASINSHLRALVHPHSHLN